MDEAEDLPDALPAYRLTQHVRDRMEERGIPLPLIEHVLRSPDEMCAANETKGGKFKFKGAVSFRGRNRLLVLIVGTDSDPVAIVSAWFE